MPKKLPARLLVILVLLFFLGLPFAAMLSSGGAVLAPYLEFVSPSTGDVLYSDFEIVYVASDDSAFEVNLFLDSVPYASDINTPFQMSGIADGSRIITLIAVNVYGLSTQRSVQVQVDGSAPVLEFIDPTEGQIINDDELLVNWTISDYSAVTLFLQVDDEEEINVTGLTQWPLTDLFEGPHSLILRGVDDIGNEGRTEVNFTVQTGRPILLFISPERNSHHPGPDIRVNWSVSPLTATLQYSLDGGVWTPGDLDGVDLIGLDEGRHTVTVNVTDGLFFTERSLSFYIDSTGPQLTIVAPLMNMSFGGSTALVIWEVEEFSPYIVTLQVDAQAPFNVSGESHILTGLTAGTHTVIVNVTDSAGNSMAQNVTFNSRVDSAPRGSISITGDASLLSTVELFGLPGNGSESNPYVLQNIGIDASGGLYALSVKGTSYHFLVQNCLFYNTSISLVNEPVGQAIYLYDVRHLSINGSIARSQDHGIYQQSLSSNLNLTNNDFSHSLISGITLNQVDDVSIIGNDLSDSAQWGLMVGWKNTVSRNLQVLDNDCSGHQRYGIAVERLEAGNISGNDVRTDSESSTNGIYLYGGTANAVIYDNDCRNNTFGIRVADFSTANLVLENDCRNNPYGIYLEQATANHIVANDCSQELNSSGYGIYISYGYENIVAENNAQNNQIGIFANHTSDETFLKNSLQNASQYGILVSGTALSFEIIGNNCSNAGLDAIRMQSGWVAYGNNIQGNDCRHNGGSAINITVGYNVTSNQIQDNDCRDSLYDLIYVEGTNFSFNTFEGNNLEDAPFLPINLNSSTGRYEETRIQYNQISRSGTYAVYMYGDIDGLYVIGNQADNATFNAIHVRASTVLMEEVFVDGNDVSSCGGDGVNITATDILNGSVSANTALNIPGTPILVDSSSLTNFQVDDNYCPHHPRSPLNITAPTLTEVSISGNNLTDSGAGIILLQRNFHNVSVSDNYLRETLGVLIHLQSGHDAYGLHVDDNDLIRIGGSGILVDIAGELQSSSFDGNSLNLLYDYPLRIISPSLNDVSVDGNICPDARDNGLNITATTIHLLSMSGNELQDSQGYGILLVAEGISGLQINGNDIRRSQNDSIHVYSPNAMDELEVRNNLLQQNGANAILISSAVQLSSLSISENNCTDSPQYPILLRSPIVRDASIHANQLYDAVDRPLWLDSDDMQDITISDNIAYGSGAFGMELNGTSVREITISGNDLRSSLYEPINISSMNDLFAIHVLNNSLQGSSTRGIIISTSADIIAANISGNNVTGHSQNQIFLQCDSLQDSRVGENQAQNSPALPLNVLADSIHGLVVIANDFSHSGSHAIELNSTHMSNITVQQNDLRYATTDALRITATESLQYIYILENDGREAGANGITVLNPSSINHLDIIGNQLSLILNDPISISTGHLNYTRIESNTCPDAVSTPLRLEVDRIYSLTIVENDFNRSGSHGIMVSADSIVMMTVSYNQINDAQGDAISIISTGNGNLTDVRIWNNQAFNATGNGTGVEAFVVDSLSIRNNDFRQSGAAGISLQVQGNLSTLTVTDNDCRVAFADAIFLRSDSADGVLMDAIIQNNLLTDNGRYGLYIEVHSLNDVLIDGNNASGSLRPLVLNVERAQSLTITENNFSGSSYEAIRLLGSMQQVIISDNDLRDSDSDGIYLQSAGTIDTLTIQRNNISSINQNGVRINASGLNSVNIDSNHIVSSGHPIWITAPDSDHLTINANNCSHSLVAAVHLQIDNHTSTVITDNDLSYSGTDGLVIDALRIERLHISGNDIRSCAGDGIIILATEQIDSVDILVNDLGLCSGTAVRVQSPVTINEMQIMDNIGGAGDGIVVQAMAWIGGNISGNLLNGLVSVLVTADLNLTHADDNVLSVGDFIFQAGAVNLQSWDGNEVDNFNVTSDSGNISCGTMISNRISGALRVDSADAVLMINFDENDVNQSVVIRAITDIDMISFRQNTIGPSNLSAVLMAGMNISLEEFHQNTLEAIGIGLEVNASGDVSLNHLLSNDITANRGIIISAQNITGTEFALNSLNVTSDGIFIESQSFSLQYLRSNYFQSGSQAVSINSSSIAISSIDHNEIIGESDHFFLIQGNDMQIGAFVYNNMSAVSHMQAVNFTASISLNVTQWNQNSLMGAVHLYAPVLQISTMNLNEIQGNISISGGTVTLSDVGQNSFHNLNVSVGSLELGSLMENEVDAAITLDVLHLAVLGPVSFNIAEHFGVSAQDLEIENLQYNNISRDMVFLASGNILIGEVEHNVAFDVQFQGSDLILESFSFNDCSGNVTFNAMANITIAALNQNQVQSLSFLSVDLTILSVDENTGGDISITASGDAVFGAVRYNNMGSFQALIDGDLQIQALENNSWNGSVHLQATTLTVTEGISANTITDGISIIADSASVPFIRFNDITASTENGIEWQSDGVVTVDISNNNLTAGIGNVGAGVHLNTAADVNLQFHDNHILGFQEAALHIDSATSVTVDVRDCSFISNGHGVLFLADEVSLNVTRTNISQNSGDGVNLSATAVQVRLDNMTIAQNQRGLVALNVNVLSLQDSEVSDCLEGVVLQGSNIIIEHSLFQGNGRAVNISETDSLRFNFNEVLSSTAEGLYLYDTSDVLVQRNLFQDNGGYALQALNVINMSVIWNEFRDNNGAGITYHIDHVQAYDDGVNNWSASRYPASGGEEGNLWSDWLSPDDNGDGIVDFAYDLDGGGKDHFPLVTLDDSYAPYLVITSPVDGSKYRNGSIGLEWVTADNRSGLSLFDTEIFIDGSRVAELDVSVMEYEIVVSTLNEGNCTLTVRVTDNDGNVQTRSIIVLVDRSAPQLMITSPAEGTIINQPFSVHWTVNDIYDPSPRTDIRVDGGNWSVNVSSGYTFTSLSDGPHLIELRAVDHLDNNVTVYLNVTVDTIDPVIDIITPVAGAIFNTSTVNLSWSVTDASPCDVYVSSNGIFWTQVYANHHIFNLADGVHTLHVKAVDAAGNEAQEDVTITVDTITPLLSLTSPVAGEIFNVSHTIVQWTVTETNDWNAEVATNGGVWTSIGQVTQYNFTGLPDGENILRVRITDAAGHSTASSVTVITDTTAPVLTIIIPAEGARFNSSTVTMQWSVTDLTDCSYEVRYDLQPYVSVGSASYIFTLSDGNHTLYLRATDAAGWTSVSMVNVSVDTTPPALSIDAPVSGETVKTASVTVQWTTDGVRSMVSLDGGAFQIATDNITYQFTVSGTHNVTVRSWDDLDNMVESTVSFDVSLTTMQTWSPQGDEVLSGLSTISVRFNKELNESSLIVRVNSSPVVYTVDGEYVNISMELMADTEYEVIITGTGVDGSEIVGAQWTFNTAVSNLGMTVIIGAALLSVAAAFLLIRPRTRRF